MSPYSEQRFGKSSRRLGFGVALSSAIHVIAVAGLTVLVTRPGSQIASEGSEEPAVVVDIGATDPDATEPTFGPPPPESGTSAREGPKQVVAGPRPVPAPVRPSTGAPGERPTGARRTNRPAARPRLEAAARASLPAEAGSDSDRAEPALPVQPAARLGTPGPSARTVFLAKMKRHLRAAWRAAEVYMRIDPNGRLQGSMFVTALQVRLRADGTVEKAELRDSSGIQDLDAEAVSVLRRIEPLGAVPRELVDTQGGFDVRCSFHLDVGLYRFANELHYAIAKEWRPSKAFAATGEQERKTIVKLMLSREGTLVQADVVGPAGIDFLDKGAVSWVKPGMRFPPPPPAFGRGDGPVPIFVAFLHLAGQPRVLKPREDLEAE